MLGRQTFIMAARQNSCVQPLAQQTVKLKTLNQNMDKRFTEVSDKDTKEFVEQQKNSNIRTNTEGNIKFFRICVSTRHDLRPPEDIPAKELD